jgi:dTDP-4-amino-4,6-dideoxygalactose transaminase
VIRLPDPMKVPFFRVDLGDDEIRAASEVLRSGWLTTGPQVRAFESEFAAAVGARHAVAVNSATAALHLAVEALGLRAGQAVLVPTLTFAATAEVVRYQGAVPVLVDCDPVTLNVDLADAEAKLADLRAGRLPVEVDRDAEPVGLLPVHVGGLMLDVDAVAAFATRHRLWTVEDAAHAFPAAWRPAPDAPWQRCGEGTSAVACFSFYANKPITTGEGGMAVTEDGELAERLRLMSLHGLSKDAWKRYETGGSWDYRIVAPGFKYNLTDVAAAVGRVQLARADELRRLREERAHAYLRALAEIEELELPPDPPDRRHSWHLFPIRLHLDRLDLGRDEFIAELGSAGVACSVHWRPLHLHPYYRETFGWRPEHLPVASREWERLVSLPLFPSMRDDELEHVVAAVSRLCRLHARRPALHLEPHGAHEE